MEAIFLGTGGGRYIMNSQVRKTGGLFFDLDDVKFIIDPGPGALVHAHSLGLKPEKWNGLLVSHLHPDNCADSNVLVDGMKGPFLVAEEHCILPKQKLKSKSRERFDYYPCISLYHQKLAELHPVKHGDVVETHGLVIHSYKSKHYDPTVGFRIEHKKITIGYPADGPYYRGQEKFYDGCDLLILNILVPKGKKLNVKKHMSVDDAINIIKSMSKKPRLVILQHFSFWMLRSNLWKQAKIIQDSTKVKTLHAEDFMQVDLETFETKMLRPV